MKDIVSQFAMQLTLAEKRELVAELKGAIAEELASRASGPAGPSRCPRCGSWIGYIFLDDFGRTKPAFLNSTGVMYPSVECILKLLYQCT